METKNTPPPTPTPTPTGNPFAEDKFRLFNAAMARYRAEAAAQTN